MSAHDHDHHPHDHLDDHRRGLRGALREIFVPHSHDASDSIDDALESSRSGIRALQVSLVVLLVTTALQLAVVIASSSVALLADTIHNFSDALTAVPLWIAFVLGRRLPTRRYTYGFGRAEDLAGLFIVLVVFASAVVAGWQSIERLLNPQPLTNVWWVLVAGVIGFAGNEAVAIYRIRVGRLIGSAALVADGIHARTDGFTSLAVVLGAVGVLLGFPLADPIIGLIISVAIFVLLLGTVRSIGRRLMDAVEPELVARAESALAGTPGVLALSDLRLRWVGHRLQVSANITVADSPVSVAQEVAHEAEHRLGHALPNLDRVVVRFETSARTAASTPAIGPGASPHG